MSERQVRVVSLTDADTSWPWTGDPYYRLPLVSKSSSQLHVDPFPCYAHDESLVRELADKVAAAFPLGFPLTFFLPAREGKDRTNGFCAREYVKYDDELKKWTEYEWYIVLQGKRIPLHPAMTRYLVGHEYGHAVQQWLEHMQGDDPYASVSKFECEYARMRGLDPNIDYGGGKWHTNTGEIIANDFRICVTGLEPEFWPHPGIKRPEDVPAVAGFWKDTKERMVAQ